MCCFFKLRFAFLRVLRILRFICEGASLAKVPSQIFELLRSGLTFGNTTAFPEPLHEIFTKRVVLNELRNVASFAWSLAWFAVLSMWQKIAKGLPYELNGPMHHKDVQDLEFVILTIATERQRPLHGPASERDEVEAEHSVMMPREIRGIGRESALQ